MTILEAIEQRHSVRSYLDKPIEGKTLERLQKLISECNKKSGLNIQLVLNEPKAFDSFMAHYGKFSGVKNYIAMVGPKGAYLDEKCGYYGELIVLEAQRMGLNTCWVKSTYKKIPDAFTVNAGEKLVVVISIGYGENQGHEHRSKEAKEIGKADVIWPEWFEKGIDAVLKAPTAVNQQKFIFTLDGNKVHAKAFIGICTKIDLGIAKYHFEIGAGRENFTWA